jgi:hypothetical protein
LQRHADRQTGTRQAPKLNSNQEVKTFTELAPQHNIVTTTAVAPEGDGRRNEEGSPTRRNDDPSTRATRGSNRVTSRDRTSIDSAPKETPRRRLRNRTVRNPSSTTKATPAAAAQEKPKYFNSEFRKRDTQQHHLGDCTVICPHCHAYMWKYELPAGESVESIV